MNTFFFFFGISFQILRKSSLTLESQLLSGGQAQVSLIPRGSVASLCVRGGQLISPKRGVLGGWGKVPQVTETAGETTAAVCPKHQSYFKQGGKSGFRNISSVPSAQVAANPAPQAQLLCPPVFLLPTTHRRALNHRLGQTAAGRARASGRPPCN